MKSVIDTCSLRDNRLQFLSCPLDAAVKRLCSQTSWGLPHQGSMAETPVFLPFTVIAMTTTSAPQSDLSEEDMRATVSQLVRLGLVVSELATMEVRPSNRNKIACEHKAAVRDVHEAHPELISADLCCHQRHQERFKVSAVLLS